MILFAGVAPGFELARGDERSLAGRGVGQGHAGVVDGVFGRGERRRVGEVEVEQVLGAGPEGDRGREDVDALVHSLRPDGLRS